MNCKIYQCIWNDFIGIVSEVEIIARAGSVTQFIITCSKALSALSFSFDADCDSASNTAQQKSASALQILMGDIICNAVFVFNCKSTDKNQWAFCFLFSVFSFQFCSTCICIRARSLLVISCLGILVEHKFELIEKHTHSQHKLCTVKRNVIIINRIY